jgi:pyruvate dehydrogenase E2 component (dihydrolipoamide acetyltransferase)
VYEFKLPDLGEGIHEGEILKWHVQPGEVVAEDAPLVEVETDKAAVTIPSPRGGKVVSLSGKVGDTLNVGDVVAVIDDGTGVGAETPPREVKPAEVLKAKPIAVVPSATPQTKGPVPAAPATRRLAREMGIDIRQVPATGPAGRVTPEDVKSFLGPTAAAAQLEVAGPRATAEFAAHAASTIPLLDIEPLPDFTEFGPLEIEPLRSIRRKVARKMVTSMTLIPHVAHMDEADVTELEEFRLRERERRKGQPGGKLTLLAFVVKAVTAGLKAAPRFNASLDPFKEEIIYKKYYNIGIAVDTGKGLVVPVIRDTDRKSIIQVAADIEALAERARTGTLGVQELRGGTFSITNIGALGGTGMLPVINYPEVAILGMSGVHEKPVVRNGIIVIRKILPLTLAFDHRIADGADAARFVTEMVRHLSDPNLLFLET